MNPAPPLDPVAVAIVIAGLIFSPQLAAVVGPYAVIILGAVLGASISAGLREPSENKSTTVHMVLWVGFSLLLTVPAALLAVPYLPDGIQLHWLLGPMAAGISGIGHKWPKLIVWLFIDRGWLNYLPGRKEQQP